VLYAEDNADDMLFMKSAFRRAKLEHMLRTVEDGQKAIDYLSGKGGFADRDRHPLPILLLLDLDLPVVSGFGVIRRIRSHADFHELPVVVFSSDTSAEENLKSINFGATDFIEKPSSGAVFLDVVEDLRRKRLRTFGL